MIWLVLIVLLLPVPAQACQRFQAAFSCLVAAARSDGTVNGGVCEIDESTSVYTWWRMTLPYRVPAGLFLGITDVHLAAKYVNYTGTRSSYLSLSNIMTVSDMGTTVPLRAPFIVPGGVDLRATFFNNSPEAQWMSGFILGNLSGDTFFRDCR